MSSDPAAANDSASGSGSQSHQTIQGRYGKPRRIQFLNGAETESEAQTHCLVSFVVKARLKHGESLFAVGESPALGSWNVELGLPLDTSPQLYPLWRTTAPLKIGEPLF